MTNCESCTHKETWHHANDIQEFWSGKKFHRTCYGIGCTCGKIFDNYPHTPLTVKIMKKKKHWLLRLLKRQKIRLEIIYKRKKKQAIRKKTKLINKYKKISRLILD